MIVIVDYDVGNVGSIANMLKAINVPAMVTSRPDDILKADKLILPGVGAFDNGIKNLDRLGLVDVLHQKVAKDGVLILGICLGAQLMTESSEEGQEQGLGWIKARTIRFFSRQAMEGYRVPHMGWNEVTLRKPSRLFRYVPGKARFYFVHSYHFDCQNSEDVLTQTHYGYDFTSSFESGNCFGVQFHPEKSHKYGMALLRSFAEISVTNEAIL
ncbi:MAG: imidazole glycerol phosphate synthase subunit HisH [Candidatus Omnitrophota bacterium]